MSTITNNRAESDKEGVGCGVGCKLKVGYRLLKIISVLRVCCCDELIKFGHVLYHVLHWAKRFALGIFGVKTHLFIQVCQFYRIRSIILTPILPVGCLSEAQISPFIAFGAAH